MATDAEIEEIVNLPITAKGSCVIPRDKIVNDQYFLSDLLDYLKYELGLISDKKVNEVVVQVDSGLENETVRWEIK